MKSYFVKGIGFSFDPILNFVRKSAYKLFFFTYKQLIQLCNKNIPSCTPLRDKKGSTLKYLLKIC